MLRLDYKKHNRLIKNLRATFLNLLMHLLKMEAIYYNTRILINKKITK